MMDEIERMLRDIPERRRLAAAIEEPVRSFLIWLVDRQADELCALQKAHALGSCTG